MGVQNRQRRAAKKRRREGRQRSGGAATTTWDEGLLAHAVVLQALQEVAADDTAASSWAGILTRPGGPTDLGLVIQTLQQLLASCVRAVVRGGWSPSDLRELVLRRLSRAHLPALATLLAEEVSRHPEPLVARAWLDDLARVGPANRVELHRIQGMRQGLELGALLGVLPVMPEVLPIPGVAAGVDATAPGPDSKLLARVRSLLAKAESTEFTDEADALSAKAQELISRHSLERLLTAADAGSASVPIRARRLWLDAPYVLPKAALVATVAAANACRCVTAEQLGCVTLVGEPADLDGVELLATSLLLQASAAMLRHGRQADRHGTSRTTSFRRSFLLSYATRIGERLDEAADRAAAHTGRAGELVVVIAGRTQRVEAETARLFPHLVSRTSAVSNGYGWAAGRAAADFALLDADLAITQAAAC